MIFIAKTLSEETKKKRITTFYNKAIEKAKLEIGKKYNQLTITDIDYEKSYDSYFNKPYHRIYVKTKCDCGVIPSSNRLSAIQCGHIKSCGCLKFNNPLVIEDLTGKKFGRLTVLGRDLKHDEEKRKNGVLTNVHWLCKCDCGNPQIKSVSGCLLKTGHTQSCGCYASEQIAKRNKKYSSKINKFIDNDDNTYYLLDDNDNKCLIDKEDYDVVKRWYWRKVDKRGNINKGYWITNVKIDDKYNKSILGIHQLIAEIKYGEYESSKLMPDHLSRNTDDNRKCNIILKSNQKNTHNRGLSKANTSGKTGVSFMQDRNMWCAYITINYKTKILGYFSQYEEAVKVRKEAEKKYNFTCDDIVASYDKEAI